MSGESLLLGTPERNPALPNLPTTKEAGLPEFQVSAWNALFAPKGTPKPILEKLNAAAVQALDDENVRKRLLELGSEIPTKDKRFIWVDSYARWRITDPLLFFQRLHDESGAQSRLDDILDGETRNTIAKHELIDVVRSTNRPFVVAEDVAELSQPVRGL